jgi:hypothetical protein
MLVTRTVETHVGVDLVALWAVRKRDLVLPVNVMTQHNCGGLVVAIVVAVEDPLGTPIWQYAGPQTSNCGRC